MATISREIAEHLVREAWNDENVARVIKEAGGLDVSACEAAGLAHDLGHPPFGHAGEAQLNRLLRTNGVLDGFEGNAQSFRIVTTLELRATGVHGLSLSNVTLAAIQKYPHTRQPGKDKFGAYQTEKEALTSCRRALLGDDWNNGRQTLEASVMDLADDIAYAVHDLEDFVGSGIIDLRFPLVDIEALVGNGSKPGSMGSGPFKEGEEASPFVGAAQKLERDYAGFFDYDEYRRQLSAVRDLLRDQFPEITEKSRPEYNANVRNELGEVVAFFFQNIAVTSVSPFVNGPLVYLKPEAWHRLQCLKVITRQYLVSTPQMGLIQQGQAAALTTLFNGLVSWLQSSPDPGAIPAELRDYVEAADLAVPTRPRADVRATRRESRVDVKRQYAPLSLKPGHFRAISDYICGMSDSEALLRSQWLAGTDVPGMASLGGTFA